MSRLPPLPQLDWKDAAPHSRDRDDVYFSGEGLSEKRAVFLGGCGLPEAWAGRERFTVGELGFGTGLNFLALWELWRRHRPSPKARLDFMSFEGMLIGAGDAVRIHEAWPELAELSRELVARWPVRARGAQRIGFPNGVTLTLFVDEISAALPQARGAVDAWFLDGFAPSKNAEMWSAEVMGHVARLSAPGARAATYTVAGDVRRNLEAAGFSVAKLPGHGRKKERLEARLESFTIAAHPDESRGPGMSSLPVPDFGGSLSSEQALHSALSPGFRRDERALIEPPKSVLVIGAGIAGACAARSFVARGCAVTVVDKAGGPGSAASGNPLALVMPRLDAADGAGARGFVEAYLYARRFYEALGPDAAVSLDAIHRPRGEKEQVRFAKLLSDPPLDETLLQASGDGLRHVGAIAVKPSIALPALLEGATLRFGAEVVAIDGNRVRLSSGETLAADLIVVCAGIGMGELNGVPAPPLTGRLGQLDSTASSGAPGAVADGGYAVEAFGRLVFGATFEAADGEPMVTDKAREENLATLARLRRGFEPGVIESRAAIRATTPDRFPFAGAPPTNEKAPDATPAPFSSLRLLGGLGARGFLWAPLLAELLASESFGEPLPVEASVAEALDPGRFIRRAARRGS